MRFVGWLLSTVVLGMSPAFADDSHHEAKPAAPASGDSAALSEGEVLKVDKDAQKITIRHGPLANLDMPAMTMVFRVKDSAMLERVKAGDKVKFHAEKIDGAITVTKIEPAQ